MKTKQVCGRCGGSGNYSFNLKDGTVCYGCNGAGFVMVNLVAVAKNEAKRAERMAAALAKSNICIAAMKSVILEMNAKYGPFDILTPLGVDQLNCATYRATQKSLARIRDERLAA